MEDKKFYIDETKIWHALNTIKIGVESLAHFDAFGGMLSNSPIEVGIDKGYGTTQHKPALFHNAVQSATRDNSDTNEQGYGIGE